MIKYIKKHLVYIIILLLNIACNPSVVFDEYIELPKESWNKDSIIELSTSIADSGLYNITLCLRHTSDYETANIWCFVSIHSQETEILKDTLNIKMADTDGRWLGEGARLKYIGQLLYNGPVTLPKGELVFRIKQGMNIDDMKGIKNVGIKVEKIRTTEQNGKK